MAAPQTDFETGGGWTSSSTEAAFLAQVAADTSASLTVAGHSGQGRPIHRLDLGAGAGNTMLVVTLQHGGERASREAALMQLRDLAYSTDPAVLAYLDTHRIVYLPTLNPDGLQSATRFANGIDTNRDWFKLEAIETQVGAQVILDANPHLVVDAHEFSGGYTEDWLGAGGGLASTHPAIKTLELSSYEYARDTLAGLGYEASLYSNNGVPRASLSASAGARHIVGLLSETNMTYDDWAGRVTKQRLILDMIRDWHEDNAAACTAAQAASKRWALTHSVPDTLMVRTEATGLDPVEHVRLEGYQLHEPLPQKFFDAFGIQAVDGFVPIQQPARMVIPQLLDPAAMDVAVSAHRVLASPPPPPLPAATRLTGMFVHADGKPRPVSAISHHDGSQVRQVKLPTL